MVQLVLRLGCCILVAVALLPQHAARAQAAPLPGTDLEPALLLGVRPDDDRLEQTRRRDRVDQKDALCPWKFTLAVQESGSCAETDHRAGRVEEVAQHDREDGESNREEACTA
jgi:hypothetical protein